MSGINIIMIDIIDYIKLSKEDRQKHLELDQACIERGGPQKGGLSAYCKGLLAHILDTSIPTGHKIYVCHACNNEKCSNPTHLYWGTAKENWQDAKDCGATKGSIWANVVEKYGYEEACRRNSNGKKGNKYGSGNAGKPKTDEHRQKTAESIKLWWNKRKEADVAK